MNPHQPHRLRHEDCDPNVTATATTAVGISRRQLRVDAISATASPGYR